MRLQSPLVDILTNRHHILQMQDHWLILGRHHPISPCTAALGVYLPIQDKTDKLY